MEDNQIGNQLIVTGNGSWIYQKELQAIRQLEEDAKTMEQFSFKDFLITGTGTTIVDNGGRPNGLNYIAGIDPVFPDFWSERQLTTKQRETITNIYKYAVHVGILISHSNVDVESKSEFEIPETIAWNEVPRLMIDCGFPVEDFNIEHALFTEGLKDPDVYGYTPDKNYTFSDKFCNAFMKASGIKIKGEDLVPTTDPLDPDLQNNIAYHELMTNYKEIKALPLGILSELFIEDHKEYEIVEHSVHVVGPIVYNVLGADLNDIQKTSVISRILKQWREKIEKLETPAAIEYHEKGGYNFDFKWILNQNIQKGFSQRNGYAQQDLFQYPLTPQDMQSILLPPKSTYGGQ